MEVIPSINCHVGDDESVRSRIRQSEKFSKWIHLDIADGKFTFNRSWADPKKWKEFDSKLNLEVHLMVDEPEKYVDEWLEAGAKRLIVHFESLDEERAKEIVKKARLTSAGVMIAINPETRISDLPPYFKNFAEYHIHTAHLGLSGQKFLPLTLHKISELRREVRSARIEIDGGITPETAILAKEAGADSIVSGSHIFNSPNPSRSFEELNV